MSRSLFKDAEEVNFPSSSKALILWRLISLWGRSGIGVVLARAGMAAGVRREGTLVASLRAGPSFSSRAPSLVNGSRRDAGNAQNDVIGGGNAGNVGSECPRGLAVHGKEMGVDTHLVPIPPSVFYPPPGPILLPPSYPAVVPHPLIPLVSPDVTSPPHTPWLRRGSTGTPLPQALIPISLIFALTLSSLPFPALMYPATPSSPRAHC
ncbi:hypothetical protein B0H16DRAFT_1747838 [Mycena metata]|uniref:Uncharacterized protein n=1 Tax=Mycena metata TaxID=1033252 RepID=A0AAD7GRP6_9AGAR|nr:hypothetical protein B0H16DRAFT_1747838 [Mycena metata]